MTLTEGMPRYLPAGDQALVVEFANEISIEVNRKVQGMVAALQERVIPGVLEVVPTYRSVLVYYRPDRIGWGELLGQIRDVAHISLQGHTVEGRQWDIPTLYGGEAGPDLADVAAHCGLSPAEVVAIHSQAEYRVFMLGFTPGFPYLGGMDSRIATPRLSTPRAEIPAGSVGIAGSQTGIYPVASPGGWRLIGRTPLKLYDPLRDPPVLFKSGDTLRFVPISQEEFHRIQQATCTGVTTDAGEASGGEIRPVLEVIRPGLLTTVQDLGRYGFQSCGMPVAGAMDRFALRAANILVGNDEGAAGLEITLLGPKLKFLVDSVIAITGGDLGPSMDCRPVPQWETVQVKAGSILSFEGPRLGCRAYLAVGGGIQVPVVMGSRSTYLRGNVGGFKGRSLQAGDILLAGLPLGPLPQPGTAVPASLRPPLAGPWEVRVVLGPQDDHFDPPSLQEFLHSQFTIKPESDRMGYRLDGPPIKPRVGDIISDGIPLGAIQVPADGYPIIMMVDRQTTGGYPKIATVISADIGKLAQAKPGDGVCFRQVTVEEAHVLFCQEEQAVTQIRRICTAVPSVRRHYRVTVDGREMAVWVEEVDR